ncbi:MAG: Uncharacterised protein [Synechococcus sp. CC9902]|nr:MAG: Uncharacterised protein [Synechococcus sp. CC9902]
MNRLALDDAGRHGLNQARLGGGDFALAIDRTAQGVDHTPQHGFANGHGGNFAGGFHRAAFLNAEALSHQHRTDVVVFEVECNGFSAVLELEEFTSHGLL